VTKALFTYAFAVRQGQERSGGADDGDQGWPVLLSEAHRHGDDLPELWARALNCEPVQELALESLRDWLRIVDDDWSAYDRVLDILAGVADRSRYDAAQLEHHLESWARDDDEPSKAAAQMLAELTATTVIEPESAW
jgi:hypothetical protein